MVNAELGGRWQLECRLAGGWNEGAYLLIGGGGSRPSPKAWNKPLTRSPGPDHPLELRPVEGRVDLTMIKRHVSGRAGLPLLRKRVLLTAKR